MSGMSTSPRNLLPDLGAAEETECQLECMQSADCVAWMHGTDDDWACTIDETCPNLVRLYGRMEGTCGWTRLVARLGARAAPSGANWCQPGQRAEWAIQACSKPSPAGLPSQLGRACGPTCPCNP
mgnify:CR=1 FL=1